MDDIQGTGRDRLEPELGDEEEADGDSWGLACGSRLMQGHC